MAKPPDESLGNHHFNGGSDEKGFDFHVDQAGDGPRSIVGVQSAQNQVARQGGPNGNVRGLPVPDFPDHDDIGVLPQNFPQSTGESETDFRIHLGLINAGNLVFDGILDRHDRKLGFVNPPDESGQ